MPPRETRAVTPSPRQNQPTWSSKKSAATWQDQNNTLVTLKKSRNDNRGTAPSTMLGVHPLWSASGQDVVTLAPHLCAYQCASTCAPLSGVRPAPPTFLAPAW